MFPFFYRVVPVYGLRYKFTIIKTVIIGVEKAGYTPGMDRTPKKPCKFCKRMGHYSYQCYANPKKVLKRTPIKKHGKHAKQWLITRATWIRKNPPKLQGQFWECYLQIHPRCPKLVDIKHLTLDHIVSRSRDPSLRYTASNLRPSCMPCNELKGSRGLDELQIELSDSFASD